MGKKIIGKRKRKRTRKRKEIKEMIQIKKKVKEIKYHQGSGPSETGLYRFQIYKVKGINKIKDTHKEIH